MIKFKHASITYNGHETVIKDLDLEIKKGEFVTLIGESGSGKTTLLKSINGLVKLSDGDLVVMDKNLREWDMHQLRRKIGYVIQQIGLFPHMTVEKNIMYVPMLSGTQSSYTVDELLELVNIPLDYKTRYPRELSGGQQQRIGVARALAADPEILLMDEPFGAVDEITRSALQNEMIELHRRLKKTIVFVTHDIEEALKLGSRIILFKEGMIEQQGSKMEMVFSHESSYVKEFFGTKHLTAYLNTTKIESLTLVPIRPSIEYETIEADHFIIEVVNHMMNASHLPLAVVREGELLGEIDGLGR